ncbi:hypothetical protein LOC71_04400 [Rhodopirellula sp. JC740]|uniref:Glycosyltransferase RgtA/B/C/D-like domain-containing protein n=1 Tax=Rhodopirellula halodulae TaxID=2894198 RepID=A0ABS8ND84_9BACT|nr:hypothetical protein [Rhodopirellula sp. JC740]MCC9641502.1 hypothetical protein [Rhodopirellula sp. JC740]
MRKHEIPRQHRRNTYAIMIVAALALAAGRISVVTSREGDTAFLSANDRSRWCTVAALVEDGTFAIDRPISIRSADGKRRPWDTIDKVRHVGADGQLHHYSSKPTLLVTMVAGVYGVVHHTTGLTLTENPVYVPRLLLLLINLPVLALFLVTIALIVEVIGASDYARRMGVAAACFGTMMLPFTISLNNHLFAAAATSLTLWLYLRAADKMTDSFSGMTYHPKFAPWFVAGASAAFAVACELPALSMLALWTVLFAWLNPKSMPGFLTGAILVLVGIVGTNQWAHGSLRTPYAHRGVGEDLESIPMPSDPSKVQIQTALEHSQTLMAAEKVELRELHDGGYEVLAERFSPANEVVQTLYKLRPSGAAWTLSVWDDWYDYPGSYWRSGKRRGVDLGEPSRVAYLFHATLGYYGIFSLTPIWILVPVGMIAGLRHGPGYMRRLTAAIALASVVCLIFYIARPEIDRNYGGVSVCFRWMLWFAPLWLYCLVPEVSSLSEKFHGRCFTLVLLGASAFSVATSLSSPWQSPWIYRFASFLGWLGNEMTR